MFSDEVDTWISKHICSAHVPLSSIVNSYSRTSGLGSTLTSLLSYGGFQFPVLDVNSQQLVAIWTAPDSVFHWMSS